MRPEAITRALENVLIPLVDLGPANAAVKARVLERISRTIEAGDFVNGRAVDEFEGAFAAYCGRVHCVGVASGLDGLRLSLLAVGAGEGARVVVPAATFAATFEAVLQAGATPVVVDVNDMDYTVDVEQTRRAAADASHLLPVHLYGQLANMAAIAQIAQSHGLVVIEDACQAHGAHRDGSGPGDYARAAVFSFYPSKNLGAMGDAGAVVTDNGELASLLRALRVHGETSKYHHEYVGYTARLDTVQAIVLVEKLSLLDQWNAQRSAAARFYSEALAPIRELCLPAHIEGSEPVWHLYVVRTPKVDQLAAFLSTRGVQTGRHYPEPPHLSSAYRGLGYERGDFPVAEALAREGLSLPLFPGISEAQLERVCDSISKFFGYR